MDKILATIKDYCEVVGINVIGIYSIPDTEYILIATNDEYIGTDVTNVVFNGIESIFKKAGVNIDD